jgi:rhamnulokinase
MPGSDFPNIVAVDLGAESCRVSLLQWQGDTPEIDLVHRFENAPVARDGTLRWDLPRILAELVVGLARCAERSRWPIASIGVDGWAVDYVRLDQRGDARGLPLGLPFCYRDARTEQVFDQVRGICPDADLFRLTGTQPLRINTLYQLMADQVAGIPADVPWINLPEYVMSWLGARFVAEHTNATHTGLVSVRNRAWCDEVFEHCGLQVKAAPELVDTGSVVGRLKGALQQLPVFAETRLIATACHDTASAVAGIPLEGDDWAYISSGTWSLVGTLLDTPVVTVEACAAGFTNLGATGNRFCFHKNVNGMWLLKQTMAQLCPEGDPWPMDTLIAASELLKRPDHLLELDDPALLLPGPMASCINAQRTASGLSPIEEHTSAMPQFANLIFHSLAERYATVLRETERLSGKKLSRLVIIGGGSRNRFLNRLAAETTGLTPHCGIAESSTIGNLAVQLASLEGQSNARSRIAHWARALTRSHRW